MEMKKITSILVFLSFVNIAAAAEVGIIVEFPDSTVFTECVNVADNADGYVVLEKTSLDIGWSEEGLFGHALCMINGIGDEPSGTGCKWGPIDYWAFLISDGSDWQYMPVGFDAGDSCWNSDFGSWDGHYCAKDKDVLGFAYGPYSTRPVFYDYDTICGNKLSFEDITIKVDGSKETGTINVVPGSQLKIKIKVENIFEDIVIKDIEVIATIEDIDDGDDLTDDSKSFDLDGGETETITLEFDIPSDVKDDDYELKIEANGKDINDFEHVTEKIFKIRVKKERHDIVFRDVDIFKTNMECGEQTKLDIEMVNYGREEEEVALEITNSEFGIDLKDSFTLSEDPFDDDNKYHGTFILEIPDEQTEGSYPITIKAEYSGKSTEEKIYVNVKCEKEDNPAAEEKVEVLQQQTIPRKKTESIKTTTLAVSEQKQSNNGISIVILALEAIAVIICVLVIIKMLKK